MLLYSQLLISSTRSKT